MNVAKIRLSEEELQLVLNADWVLTKNKIIQKVYHLFGGLSEEMKIVLQHVNLPEEIVQTNAKISRGESYKELPYIMLDYPRLFSQENIFAVRIFFWWGNYFSITLHLKGVYKEMFINNIRKNISLLTANNFYICISENEWQHELDDINNYYSLSRITENETEKIFAQKTFLKFSAKISFHQWNEMEIILGQLFKIVMQSVQD